MNENKPKRIWPTAERKSKAPNAQAFEALQAQVAALVEQNAKLTALLDTATTPNVPAPAKRLPRGKKMLADRPQDPPNASAGADPRLRELDTRSQWQKFRALAGYGLAWDANERVSEYRVRCANAKASGARWTYSRDADAAHKSARNADGTYRTPEEVLRGVSRRAPVASAPKPMPANVDPALVAAIVAALQARA